MLNITLSFNPTAEMNTTEFKRREIDYVFKELGKVLKMGGRYSSFIFTNNYRKTENYQRNVSNCIILDFDEDYTREEFKKSADFAYAIGTTKSHMIDKNGLVCERFRVIIPTWTAIDLNAEEYSNMMREIFEVYTQADKACKDTARAYSGYAGAKVEIIHGELFDWEQYHDKAVKRKELRRWQQSQKEKPQLNNDGTKEDWYRANWLNDKMFEKLKVEERIAGGRNNGLYVIARYLKEVGLTDSEICDALAWANINDLPEVEVKSILRGLRIQI